jgi:hypothetical protein
MTIYIYHNNKEAKKKKRATTMSIERLERVLWRLRKRNPGKTEIKLLELQRAIIYELGTDPRTYRNNKKALITIGWITSQGKMIRLTDKDLTES